MNIRAFFPNALTCINLVCGVFAIIFALRGGKELPVASLFLGFAAVADLLDGMVARILKVSGEFGKQLDSLADMVSFGVAPGIIFYSLTSGSHFLAGGPGTDIFNPTGMTMHRNIFDNADFSSTVALFLSLVMIVFSALRLAKFNIDTRQTDSFIGVPTPAIGLLVASFPLILHFQPGAFENVIVNPFFIFLFPIIASWLMVSELPLLSLKFKNLSFRDNRNRWILIGIGAVLAIFLRFAAVPFIFAAYILISILTKKSAKKHEIHS